MRKTRPLEILTDEQVEAIHEGTLEALENTGINIFHDRALKLLRDSGCDVTENRVRFPSSLVEECLRKVPSSFRMKARNHEDDLRIGSNRLHFMYGAAMRIVDLETWETRPATLKELDDATRIADALDTVHIIPDTAPYMELVGVPPVMAYIMDIVSHLRNSTKITVSGYQSDCETFQIRIAKTVGVDMLAFIGAAAPLTFHQDSCEALFRYAAAGFPFMVVASDVMGGTGPATIAGSLVSTNAEIIGTLILIQLTRPGTGILASDYTMPLDMRTGHPCFGDVGASLHTVAFTQIMRKYGIPTFANSPGFASSKKIDFQAAYERSMSTLAAALAGVNVIVLHGSIYGEYTFHPVQAVLDDDIANWVGRLLQGFEVDDETLALNLIDEVGPIPGSYLGKPHTRKWWKSQQFIPQVADRLTYPEWIREGKKSAIEYAQARMDEILRTHHVPPIPRDQDQQIEAIVKEAEKHYAERGLL